VTATTGHSPGDPSPDAVTAITGALDAAQAAADDLLLHLQLAHAASYGPSAVVDAAMADVATRADALARADAACRRAAAPVLATGDEGPGRLADVLAGLPDAEAAIPDARARLRSTVESIEQRAHELALELARRRADIDEVLRHAAGSPGTYDALGRTSPGAARRPRGAG
jgi:hypothetical protein